MATERRHTWATLGAGTMAGLVLAAVLMACLLWVAGGGRPMPVSFGRTYLGVLGLVISPIAFAAVGAVLASQLPRNPIGWIFLMVAVAVGMMLPVNLLVTSIHESLRQAPTFVVWIAWFRTAFGSPLMIPALIIAALIFPDGRPLGRRWRWPIALAGLGGLLLIVTTAVDPRGLWSYPTLPNPAALPFDMEPAVTALRIAAMAILAPTIGLAVAAVWLRYRQGSDTVRAQLRWIVLGVAISALCVLPYLAARFIVDVDDNTGELLAAIAQIGSIAFPLAAAVAISRYRLFDIDLLIGRTLVYVPLMAILGGLYTAGITLSQRLFVAVMGQTSDLAIVLTVLLVATVFTPLRRALESVAEHRFPTLASDSDHRMSHPSPAGHVDGPEAAFVPGGPLDASHADASAQIVAVAPSGAVACPLWPDRTVYDCLTCAQFRATLRDPTPAIVCQLPSVGP